MGEVPRGHVERLAPLACPPERVQRPLEDVVVLQRRLAEHERIERAAQDGDDGDLAWPEEIVEPHQRKLDGVLAAVVILLGECVLLTDFGGEGVDDVLCRGQRPRRGVA